MNTGMKIWGWVDMPSTSYEFSTCDPTVGDQVTYYAEKLFVGNKCIDVLNYPGKYIDFGDCCSNASRSYRSECRF